MLNMHVQRREQIKGIAPCRELAVLIMHDAVPSERPLQIQLMQVQFAVSDPRTFQFHHVLHARILALPQGATSVWHHQAARALLSNEDLKLGPYMHLLMPALLSCVLTKRIGRTPMDDHWRLRDTAAGIIALACARLQTSYANLQRRVTTEYVKAFTDESKPLASHYGEPLAHACISDNC